MSNQGSRGGTTASLKEAERLYWKWRRDEYGWLSLRVLEIAYRTGEFHGDALEDVKLKERSIVGAVVNGLVRSSLLETTGEHRRSRTEASHGRRSYVYRLTPRGRSVIQVRGSTKDTMLGVEPPPEERDVQQGLFDVPIETPGGEQRIGHADTGGYR